MRNRWMHPALALLTLAIMACEETPAQVTEGAEQLDALALQEGRPGPGGGILELAERLELSDEQVTEIRGLLAELREANAPLMEQLREERESREGMRGRRGPRGEPSPAMRQIRENGVDAMRRIRAVLTAEQQERARELMAERRAETREHRAERGPRGFRDGPGARGAPLLRLRERLGLTPDQVARIEAIQEGLREENRPLMEQLRASGERPFRGGRGDEASPLAQELRENAREAFEAMRALLTAEQLEALEELRTERPRRGRGPAGG